jgi:hypothetical protein
MRRSLLAMLSASVFGLTVTPAALAGDTPCIGALPPGTYDNVVVPEEGGCTLTSSVVRGDVKVLRSAVFLSFNNVVAGNVKGERGSTVELNQTVVRGNVQSSEGNNLFLGPGAPGNQISGNVDADKTPLSMLSGQSIRGDVTVSEAGAFTVVDSTIRGGLKTTKVAFVSLANPQVGKGIQLEEGSGQVQICGARVDEGNLVVKGFTGPHVFVLGAPSCPALTVAKGNLQVFDNTPTTGLQVSGTDVAQNLQVLKTRGAGFKGVQNNRVGDTIQCFDNDQPFGGGPNMARRAEGQCF